MDAFVRAGGCNFKFFGFNEMFLLHIFNLVNNFVKFYLNFNFSKIFYISKFFWEFDAFILARRFILLRKKTLLFCVSRIFWEPKAFVSAKGFNLLVRLHYFPNVCSLRKFRFQITRTSKHLGENIFTSFY